MKVYRDRREICKYPTRVRTDEGERAIVLTSISETGCSLTGPGTWRKGARLQLSFKVPAVTGEVTRTFEGGCGVRFERRLCREDVLRVHSGNLAHVSHYREMR